MIRSVPIPTLIQIPTRPGEHARSLAVASTALALLVVLWATATGTGVAESDRPTVKVVGGTVTESGTTTVRIALTAAPEGLAGYNLRLSVADGDVARIEDASYPDLFDVTTEPELGGDGRTITLEAVDLGGSIEPGATDVTLATVEVTGVSPGEARFTVDPIQFDADGGSAIDPATRSAAVTVTPTDGGDAAPSDDGGDSGPGSGDTDGSADDTSAGGDATERRDRTGAARDSGGGGDRHAPSIVVLVAVATALLAVGLAIGRRL
jgi:hypothetical protein